VEGEEGGFLGETYRVVDSLYQEAASAPPWWTEPVARIRRLRVLPLWIRPFRWDPATEELWIAREVEVEVRVGGSAGEKERGWRPSPLWDRILSEAVVGYPLARRGGWVEPARVPPRPPARKLPPGPLVKIGVRRTGLVRLEASEAIAAGFPQGVSVDELRVFRRSYDPVLGTDTLVDVPVKVFEDPAGTPGVFDGADRLVFYGLSVADDPLRWDPFGRYAWDNVYWLAAAPGTVVPERTVGRGTVGPDTARVTFPQRFVLHEDRHFLEGVPPHQGEDSPILDDVYVLNLPMERTVTLKVRVHAPAPAESVRVVLQYTLGFLKTSAAESVEVRLSNASGSRLLGKVKAVENRWVRDTLPPVPAGAFVEGWNDLVFRSARSNWPLYLALREVRLEYLALLRASGDRLEFTNGSLRGDTSLAVTGLSRRDLTLWDVTDPDRPVFLPLADSLFVDLGGRWALAFRDVFDRERRYWLTPIDSVQAPSWVASASSERLLGSWAESGVDVLVVAPAEFFSEARRWVDYRRAQGYRVLLADVQTVFDEFNGGVPHPVAIKRFARHFFERGGASVLLLLGDGSEDAKRVENQPGNLSGPNFVPTATFPERTNLDPFFQDEVVASDKYYVLFDNDFSSSSADYLPDMLLGRLPAGSTTELRNMVEKIFLFESPRPEDAWRRRIVLVADDAWSSKGLGYPSCYVGWEEGFELHQRAAAAIVDSSLAGGFDLVRFFLSDFTDAIHPSGVRCVDAMEAVDFTRTNVTPVLLNELGQGATLVSVQSHMNRFQIAHEFLFTSNRIYGLDYASLSNFGRPFVFMAMGCHMSEFAIAGELSQTLQSGATGDCLNELLLLVRNRGAVSTYGSTGFEYLSTMGALNGAVFDRLFRSPPWDTLGGRPARPRWILGEVLYVAEVLGAYSSVVRRMHLLGDPLLFIEAGPPRFQVTVDGRPVQDGDPLLPQGDADSVVVEAVVSDENGIDGFRLWVDGEDWTDSMEITPLSDLGASTHRRVKLRFVHRIVPREYTVVIEAYQAPDTQGTYQVTGRFRLEVRALAELYVGDRPLEKGDLVPRRGDYRLELRVPMAALPSDIAIALDDSVPVAASVRYTTPGDSTRLEARFHLDLDPGPHRMRVRFRGHSMATFEVTVGERPGLFEVIAYPNPFRDRTAFVFTNELPIDDGWIELYTPSGHRIARLEIPPRSRLPGQNAVEWAGREWAGDRVGNGVYLYVVTVRQDGRTIRTRGRVVKAE
jgi:hypothetical protein